MTTVPEEGDLRVEVREYGTDSMKYVVHLERFEASIYGGERWSMPDKHSDLKTTAFASTMEEARAAGADMITAWFPAPPPAEPIYFTSEELLAPPLPLDGEAPDDDIPEPEFVRQAPPPASAFVRSTSGSFFSRLRVGRRHG